MKGIEVENEKSNYDYSISGSHCRHYDNGNMYAERPI